MRQPRTEQSDRQCSGPWGRCKRPQARGATAPAGQSTFAPRRPRGDGNSPHTALPGAACPAANLPFFQSADGRRVLDPAFGPQFVQATFDLERRAHAYVALKRFTVI